MLLGRSTRGRGLTEAEELLRIVSSRRLGPLFFYLSPRGGFRARPVIVLAELLRRGRERISHLLPPLDLDVLDRPLIWYARDAIRGEQCQQALLAVGVKDVVLGYLKLAKDLLERGAGQLLQGVCSIDVATVERRGRHQLW